MSDIGTHTTALKDAGIRRRRKPQRSRLGKTWQDRSWRQKLLVQTPAGKFQVSQSDRELGGPALLSRH